MQHLEVSGAVRHVHASLGFKGLNNMSVSVALQNDRACAILSSVACPALQYFFPHYLINDTIFEKKKLLITKCAF